MQFGRIINMKFFKMIRSKSQLYRENAVFTEFINSISEAYMFMSGQVFQFSGQFRYR